MVNNVKWFGGRVDQGRNGRSESRSSAYMGFYFEQEGKVLGDFTKYNYIMHCVKITLGALLKTDCKGKRGETVRWTRKLL